ncbi:tRNA (adenosine(37)-N6)-threonylcarbamoyltransferase complex ATPase subunit type 1 TsaE [Vallitalea guaymasensis]|uniref:tRNA threonylcarbamoyladenosine biosynthesis protein TsaE n=1 Tax=Vallitalea guaymasensis TaxID=1185412 RepID=A0A8J8MC65_9FIRM|nr:tRNA (adenosine(37)-N6)-threonylcarbamoyltransferase complex ATPase subunit type 1 TsaE [Vallitalea guaymasensis]QUH30198.1 tRNA (adenosine(37)-N6)-threonylcarbamoyltransferase complex ATPase subunit type 1 TsaE [Vallitalea guaymasensis]
MIYKSFSAEETKKIGKELGQDAKKGQIYCLMGDLGVGKTVFTKGFAEGLGIDEHITSPTFTIVNEYHTDKLNFNHFDVYRIDDPDEMYEIGYEEYFYNDGVCLIEWANLIEEIIPEEAIWINIEKDLDKGLDYRQITIAGGINR